MNHATVFLHPSKPPIHVASNTAEKGNPLEAAAQCDHEGYYYLFVTYGLAAQGIRSTYRMVVGRSKNPEGPYLGYDGTPIVDGGHPDVLKSSPPMIGPGGGNIFRDAHGEWCMAIHYYDATRYWRAVWGRPTLQVRPIVWGADGWPLPGLPKGIQFSGAKPVTLVGSWTCQTDFADPHILSLLDNRLC